MTVFTVTTNADGEAGSELTLREAITAANATEGTDIIEFDTGAFPGASGDAANTIRLERELGPLLITDSVVIDATRVAGVTITGDASGNDVTTEDGITDIMATPRADLLDNVRPMAITDGNEETLLRGLTLTGGYVRLEVDPAQSSPGVPGAGSNGWSGGGLFVDEGSVTFELGAVSGNAVEREEGASGSNLSAGGIFFRETVNPFAPEPQADILRVIRSSVEGNHVIGEGTGSGGGIYASFLQLEDSTVANNSTEGSTGYGGGIALAYDGSLRNATIFGNVTKGDGVHGGGVWAPNNLEILNSTIILNRAEGVRSQGGGVSSVGGSPGIESIIGGDEKRIANSIILGNVADFPGTGDVALSFFRRIDEGFDENTFDGVNIIGELRNPVPDLTTINGPILDFNINAIFDNGGELKDNGGEVKTVKLRDSASNPAIDGAGEGALEADAIGRPAQDWPGRGNESDLPGVRDLGAHELPFLTGGPPQVEEGTEGNDTLRGAGGDDTLSGGDGNDFLSGGDGDDLLQAGDGTDTVNGGEGNDRIEGGATAADRRDTIFAGGGNDLVDAGHGNDLVYGQDGNDTIAGGFGVDELFGQNGNDVITGSAFSDLVFGGDGDDFVNGGFGFDRINGGTGADKFFHAGADGHASDWVQDYSAAEGDVLFFGDATARASDFVVRTAHTASASGERAGDDAVQEAFVNYKGQTLWALVDGAGEAQINLQIGGEVFDLLA